MKYVVFLLISISLFCFTGCGKKSAEKKIAEKIAEHTASLASDGQVKIDSSNDGTFTITTRDGSTVFSSAAKLPPNFPKDIPIYKGASIINSVQGEDAIGVTLQTSDSIQAIVSFYKKEMADRGWKEEASLVLQGNTMLSYVLADRVLNVVINDAGSARVINLGLVSAKDPSK